jgi:hypothetical protein
MTGQLLRAAGSVCVLASGTAIGMTGQLLRAAGSVLASGTAIGMTGQLLRAAGSVHVGQWDSYPYRKNNLVTGL